MRHVYQITSESSHSMMPEGVSKKPRSRKTEAPAYTAPGQLERNLPVPPIGEVLVQEKRSQPTTSAAVEDAIVFDDMGDSFTAEEHRLSQLEAQRPRPEAGIVAAEQADERQGENEKVVEAKEKTTRSAESFLTAVTTGSYGIATAAGSFWKALRGAEVQNSERGLATKLADKVRGAGQETKNLIADLSSDSLVVGGLVEDLKNLTSTLGPRNVGDYVNISANKDERVYTRAGHRGLIGSTANALYDVTAAAGKSWVLGGFVKEIYSGVRDSVTGKQRKEIEAVLKETGDEAPNFEVIVGQPSAEEQARVEAFMKAEQDMKDLQELKDGDEQREARDKAMTTVAGRAKYAVADAWDGIKFMAWSVKESPVDLAKEYGAIFKFIGDKLKDLGGQGPEAAANRLRQAEAETAIISRGATTAKEQLVKKVEGAQVDYIKDLEQITNEDIAEVENKIAEAEEWLGSKNKKTERATQKELLALLLKRKAIRDTFIQIKEGVNEAARAIAKLLEEEERNKQA